MAVLSAARQSQRELQNLHPRTHPDAKSAAYSWQLRLILQANVRGDSLQGGSRDCARVTGNPELIWETGLNFRITDNPGVCES